MSYTWVLRLIFMKRNEAKKEVVLLTLTVYRIAVFVFFTSLKLLLDLKQRGMSEPKLMIGDGAIGF